MTTSTVPQNGNHALKSVECSWDDALDGNFPRPEPTADEQRLEAFQVSVRQAAAGMDTAPWNVRGALQKAMDFVLAGAVELRGDTAYVKSNGKVYEVLPDAGCTCEDSRRRSRYCKHFVATELASRLQSKPEVSPSPAQENGSEAILSGQTAVPSQFLTQIHGKPFVQYAGLLAMAHERGLVNLSAHFISVDSEMALAEATAEFADGKTFMECADASPDNVNTKIRPHFPRMALTRAKARALRDALNISMCSLEELEV